MRTFKEVLLMQQRGILPPDNRLELIRGELVEMSPIGKTHGWVVNWISKLFNKLIEEDQMVWVQTSILFDEHSAPEPDIALVQWKKGGKYPRHPQPDEILLIIEVADTSLAYDRKVKAPLYASFGIPEYWILDLEKQRVERYRLPQQDSYGEREVVGKGQVVVVPGLGAEVAIEEMLGIQKL